ncbi:MAG: ABC transporter ATP-binding protein [Gammaproteobacteria bacterium]|nr:MAG: ABC transporter ATP-binding protein [Gammaproteobacteria bacterium]
MTESKTILETKDLTIRFGGHVAVNSVSCKFERGTLTSIVGPNGAGKTTYFNLISGQLPPSEGRVLLNGKDVTDISPADKTLKGIGRAFQLTNLFPMLTVLENVRLAVQGKAQIGFSLIRMADTYKELIEKAEFYLEKCSLIDKKNTIASVLSHGDQRKLEVAVLMALEPEVFMFDEPTAGMSVDDVPVILDLIHEIKESTDKTIMLVEHKMDVIKSLSDRIIVLHNGTLLEDGEPEKVIASPIVQEVYLGVEAKKDD